MPKVDTTADMEEITDGLAMPVEGRGDPTSTMLWSPRKLAGHKRPLDRLELEASEEEEEVKTEEEAVAAAKTDKMIEEAGATRGVDYEMGELLQVEGRATTEGKSVPKRQTWDSITEAAPVAVEAPRRPECLHAAIEEQRVQTEGGEKEVTNCIYGEPT